MSADGLKGRVAVVTGALGNLGPVWTGALTAQGAKVYGIDIRESEGVFPADVTDRPSLQRVLDQIGTPAILVNNAGVFNCTQVFGQAMCQAGRGSIVNIGSLYAGVAPIPAFYDHIEPPFVKPAAYGASKAAVVNLTRYFARLWGLYGVRVNTLSPGGVRAGQDDEFVRKYSERVPLGRMAETSDLVGPLLFLVSDDSSYLTGHELRVDGGFTA